MDTATSNNKQQTTLGVSVSGCCMLFAGTPMPLVQEMIRFVYPAYDCEIPLRPKLLHNSFETNYAM